MLSNLQENPLKYSYYTMFVLETLKMGMHTLSFSPIVLNNSEDMTSFVLEFAHIDLETEPGFYIHMYT